MHIPMNTRDKNFLRVVVDNRHYQFKVLAFGIKSAPRIFTKCLAVVAAYLRRQGIHVYPYCEKVPSFCIVCPLFLLNY